jgi:YHYH protein
MQKNLAIFLMLATIGSLSQTPAWAASSSKDPLDEASHLFSQKALVGKPKIVDCKLSGGTATKCIAITVNGQPDDHATGPWCPSSITDTKEAGGIWLENGRAYDVDGPFIKNMGTFYKDTKWSLYDPATGKIKVTDTKAACDAAARPDVDPAYQNYCVQCKLEYMEGSTQRTYVLPMVPKKAAKVKRVSGFQGTGVALNGVLLDGPAPKDAILGAHTIAPFDDCGGHVNLHAGYHYHAVTGCSTKVASTKGHAPVIGLAMDGYKLHARLNADGKEPTDLDQCRGHSTKGIGYHYHANAPGKNAILACHTGEVGCSNEGSDTTCDASKMVEPRRGPPPDYGDRPPPKQK